MPAKEEVGKGFWITVGILLAVAIVGVVIKLVNK